MYDASHLRSIYLTCLVSKLKSITCCVLTKVSDKNEFNSFMKF